MLKIAKRSPKLEGRKPLKHGGTEEAEELGRLPEVPRLPKIAENENQKPLQRRETDGERNDRILSEEVLSEEAKE